MRSMGRVGMLATRASELAIEDAGLLGDPLLKSGQMGVAFGSSSGSPPALSELAKILITNNTDSVRANSYIQIMPHMRSEERRVGKACVSTCRSRWSP